ncbi:MAG: sensor histidine kinase, partial [Flammeovirgaceae bacterium]
QAGEQMLILTTNLLDTQKFEEAEIKLTNEDILVSKLIQAAKSRVDIVAKEKGIQIEVHSAPQNAVFADLDLITRVMVNLLTNSIKYSPHQSTITLTSSIIEERMVKIEIQDEGQGIPKEKQGVIFQKFGQVMAKKSGAVRSTGIGLYFCKLAIEAHMGEIGVESAVGEGANFWFTIPIGNVDGEIALPEEVVETEIPQAKLSDTDKQFLKSILVNYEGVKMYELTKMRQLLNQISEDSVGITDWKGKLKQAIDSMDEQAFHNLVSTL